ncbi:MAG: hypothetical protein ACLQQ4_17140 [Bacteroidia bacterium]
MKKLLIFLGILCLLAILLVVTKPTPKACIDGIKEKIDAQITRSQNSDVTKTAAQAVSDFFIDRFGNDLYRIDDRTFFQDIYIKNIDQRIGIGICGFIIFTNQQAVQQKYDDESKSVAANIAQNLVNKVDKAKQWVENIVKKKPEQSTNSNAGDSPLQNINKQITKDSLAYINVQKFHFGRLPAKKQEEVNNALQQLQADRQRKEQLLRQ